MGDSELPSYLEVEPECTMIGHNGGETAVFECSDDAVGCSVEEWYPELDEGYYILDMEYREVLDHTTDQKVAWAFAVGYERGAKRVDQVPLFNRKHEAELEDV